MFDAMKRAQMIAGMLAPKVSGGSNLYVLAEALEQARVYGRNEVYDAPLRAFVTPLPEREEP